jgi:ATP-dependent RNA helicase RhlE
LKSSLLVELLKRDIIADAIVFTKTKHRANRLADFVQRHGISTARIHGNRSQSQRTAALDGFKSGQHRVLVATDIVARGIDVEELGHVVNFDVPAEPDAYIHRVGRTARAEATGDAFTFVSPDEEADLRAIERAIGRPLPRVTLPDFDYARKTTEKLEIPIRERLAAARAMRGPRRDRPGAPAPSSGPRTERGGHRPAGPRPTGQRPSQPPARNRESRFEEILNRHAPAQPQSRPSGSGAHGRPRRPR